jgi:L-gulono-1,4-lactone dehydrogenase
MMRSLSPQVRRNWAGNEACVPGEFASVNSTGEVAALVKRARAGGGRVKVIGAGHSFTPIAMTKGILISMDAMNTVSEIDPETGRVRVQAGIRLKDLNTILAAAGLALPNLGDINVQSLAGAISTATHGTGRDLPNIGANVVAMELVTGTGEVVHLSETNDPGALSAARAGLGALGVITEVTIQCVPAFNLHAIETVEPLASVTGDIEAFIHSADHTELFWMPGARRARVKRNHRTTEPARPQPRLAYIRDKWIGENIGFGLMCRAGRSMPSLAPVVGKLLTSSSNDRELIDRSDRIFSSPRHVRFLEMEYGIELAAVGEALDRIGALVKELSFPPLFPIEVRVSAADDAPLSTGYGRRSGWIAVHQYKGAPHEAYFRGVEQIMDDYGGRPHWGKMHYQSAATLESRYPAWDRFAEVRARLDPDGVFRNPYLDRVLGPVRPLGQ